MNRQERVQLVQALTRHQSLIKSYAYAVTRDFHLAEDVYQEVAVILAEKWEEVPGGEGVIPWLRETTRRKSLESLRKKRRTSPLLSDDTLTRLGDQFGTPRDVSEGTGGLQSAMSQCVAKLAPAARNVVEARWSEGLSCDQIAHRTGRTIQGVYALLKRARLFLSQCVSRTIAAQDSGRAG